MFMYWLYLISCIWVEALCVIWLIISYMLKLDHDLNIVYSMIYIYIKSIILVSNINMFFIDDKYKKNIVLLLVGWEFFIILWAAYGCLIYPTKYIFLYVHTYYCTVYRIIYFLKYAKKHDEDRFNV